MGSGRGSGRATSDYVTSCNPQCTQYVYMSIRLFACSLSLHFLVRMFAFTASPQFGQYRTGASERL
jgi:hypothetical protein